MRLHQDGPSQLHRVPSGSASHARVVANDDRRASRLRDFLRRYGAVTGLGAAIALVSFGAAASGDARHSELVSTLGLDLEALQHGRLWVVPLSPFVQADPGMGYRTVLLVGASGLALLALARKVRQRTTIATFFGTHAISSLATLGVLAILARAGSDDASVLLRTPDTGVSACLYGSLAAAAALQPRRTRIVGGGLLAAWLASTSISSRLDVAIAHGIAALAGAGIGTWLSRRQSSGQSGVVRPQ